MFFKFYNLELALGTNYRFYTSVEKGINTKDIMIWGTNFFIYINLEEKMLGEAFFSSTSILNRVRNLNEILKD